MKIFLNNNKYSVSKPLSVGIPKITSWMNPEEIEFRKAAPAYLQKAFDLGTFPDNRPTGIKVLDSGGSVIFKIETKNGSYVVKMSREKNLAEREEAFYQQWEQSGVSVPEVYGGQCADDIIPVSIMSMNYINAKTLICRMSSQEIVKNSVAREMGRTLAIMHNSKGQGFGKPRVKNPLVGTYNSFTEYMDKCLFKREIVWLISSGIIENKDVKLARKAVDIVEKDFKNGTKPTLNHNDFTRSNIFSTNPITIFDPQPSISHPYLCLAHPLLESMIHKIPKAKEREEILAGYKEFVDVDKRVLAAATVIRAMIRFRNLHRNKQHIKADKLKDIINQSTKMIA